MMEMLIWDEELEHYFEGVSKPTKDINVVLEEIYSVSIEKHYNHIRTSDIDSFDIEDLSVIIDELHETNYFFDVLRQYDYTNEGVEVKREHKDLLEEQIKQTFLLLKDHKESSLKSLKKDLKESKDNLEYLENIRAKSDSIDNFLWGDDSKEGLFDLLREEKLLFDIDKPVREYHSNRSLISEIDSTLSELIKRYQSFETGNDPASELKSLHKTTKSSFLKSDIVKKCETSRYYEGLIRLDNFNSEIEKVSENPEKYISKKDSLGKKVDSLDDNIDSFNSETLSASSLKELLEFDLSDINYDLIYLQDLVEDYNQKIESIRAIRQEVVAREEERVVGYFGQENVSVQSPELEEFVSKAELLGIRVKGVNEDFPVLDSNLVPNQEVLYVARHGLKYDVRRFVTLDDMIITDLVKDNSLAKGTFDEIAYNAMLWVHKNIDYTGDPQISKHTEEWLFPNETLQLGKGDCEDGTNLMVSLMRAAGVPADRVRNVCGRVPEGGHSWPAYRRQSDDEWVSLDFSYKPSNIPIEERVLLKDVDDYEEIWFAFNDEQVWAYSKMAVDRNDFVKDKHWVYEETRASQPEYERPDEQYLFTDDLNQINTPADTRYSVIDDVLRGREGANGWLEKMKLLSEKVEELEKNDDLLSSDYPLQVAATLERFYDHGYLGDVAGLSSENDFVIKETINSLYQLHEKVAGKA